MKNATSKPLFIALIFLFFSFIGKTQNQDFGLAKSIRIQGVYFFINSEPVSTYDFVGNTDKFDCEADRKELEKIIKKARKKHPYFDGIMVNTTQKKAELIKFIEKETIIMGFKVGDTVSYPYLGNTITGVIIFIDDAKKRATIEYVDVNGDKDLDRIYLKNMIHAH